MTVGALGKLAQAGVFEDDGPVVALITGMGLKTSEALTGKLGPDFEISGDLDNFDEEMRLISA